MRIPGVPYVTVSLIVLLALLPPTPWIARAAAQSLTFVLDAPVNREAEARIVSAQLAEAGIRAEVKVWDKSDLREAARKGLRRAYLTDWGSSFFDPFDLAIPKLTAGGPGNFSFYFNPQVEELLNRAAFSSDSGQRERDYRTVQQILFLQTPWIFGYTLPRFEGVSRTVHGYAPALDGRVNLHDVELSGADTLTVALDASAFRSLDPAAYRGRETETVIRNLFDALVTRTPDGRVVMQLAEFYEQPDPTTYLFTLRNGPRFHDGSPVTVDDVVYTFERILNPYGLNGVPSPRRDLLGPLRRVERVGPGRVKFSLDRPFPLFLQALVHFQIVCKKYVQQSGEKGFEVRPIGAGPFRFVGGTVDTEVVMERFEDYYGGSPDLPPIGPARIKRVIFRPVPDAMERVAALLRGTAQIVQDIPIDKIRALELNESVRILSVESTRSYQIELNNALWPFNDIRVRKAVSLAIDWKDVLNKAYDGYGRPLATCFLPNGFGFDPSLKPSVRNLEAVRQLLEGAGYDSTQVFPPAADVIERNGALEDDDDRTGGLRTQ